MNQKILITKGIQNVFQTLMSKKKQARKGIFIISKNKKNSYNILNLNKNSSSNKHKNTNDSNKKTKGSFAYNDKDIDLKIDSDDKDSFQNSMVINDENKKNKIKFANDSFHHTDNSYGDNYSTSNSNIENEKKKENNSLINNKEYIEETKKSESNNSIEMIKENESDFDFDSNDKKEEEEYIDEIFQNLKIEEENNEHKINPNYFKAQLEINDKMRIILMDWLLLVNDKLKFKEETLHIAIYIIDAYLSKRLIKRTNFQLLGVTALFIATKLNEIIFGGIKNYVLITDNAYKEKDILSMENNICRTLNFNFLVPTCLSFFQILSKKIGIDEDSKEFKFGIFLIKNFLICSKSLRYKYSTISSAACFLIMKLLYKENNINFELLCNESITIIEECGRNICKTITELFNCDMNLSVKNNYYEIFNFNKKNLISLYNN